MLGVLSLPFFRFVVVGLAALSCGLLALWRKETHQKSILAVAGMILGGVSLVALLPHTFDWFSSSSTDTWVRQPIGQLDLGHCLKGKVKEERVDIVPCGTLHHGEVVGVRQYQAASGAPYPGRTGLKSYGSKNCERPLAAYVDLPPGESGLDVVVFLPRADEWQTGVRRVLCVVTDGGSPLHESLRGSEL